MPFGKWKGRLLEDIPLEYLRWLLDTQPKSSWIWQGVAKEVAKRERKAEKTNDLFSRQE